MDGMPFLASSQGPQWLPAAAAEARRFAYWGQIVCLIFFIVWVIVGLITLITITIVGFVAIWGVIYVIFGVIDLLIMYLLKSSVFDPIDQGKFREASDHLLIWGVVGLVLGAVIPGLFLLLAWIKIQEVFQAPYQTYQSQSYYQAPPQYQAPPPQPPQAAPQYQPVAPAPAPQPTPVAAPVPPPAPAAPRPQEQPKADMAKCKNCGVQYPSFMRNCPNCGTPR